MFQLRFRILLHDARAALGAKHTLIHKVITVALNEADVRLAVLLLGRHIDAAAAGAHVARRVVHRLLAAVFEKNFALAGRCQGRLWNRGRAGERCQSENADYRELLFRKFSLILPESYI